MLQALYLENQSDNQSDYRELLDLDSKLFSGFRGRRLNRLCLIFDSEFADWEGIVDWIVGLIGELY